jgi:adenylosuccinate synthase
MSTNGQNGQAIAGGEGLDLNVSASETSKGGLKYEVIIDKPKVTTPPRVASPATLTPKPLISAELLKLRQDAAAERRLSMEAERRASLIEKLRKVDEAAKRREEDAANFVNVTKENLEKKIEAHVEKRENYISDLKTKMSSHTSHLQEVRQNMEKSMTEIELKGKEEWLTKLEAHEKNREKVLQDRLETLKKHDERIEQVRSKRNSSMCEAGAGDNNEIPPADPAAK